MSDFTLGLTRPGVVANKFTPVLSSFLIITKSVESIINISLHNISAQSCVIVVIKGLEGTSVFDRAKFKPSSKTAIVWKDYIIPQRYSRFIRFLVLLGKNLAKF